MKAINKIAVIGGGPMGGVVAAHLANAGAKVLWLSYRKPASGNPLTDAVEKMLKTSPAPFMSKSAAKLIEVGNIDDDLGRVAECDWVIEAIMERLDLKQSFYRRLDAVRRSGTAVSSNTSTIPLAKLIEGMPETLRRDFLITHFFNPTRYMRLLEVVAGPDSDTATVDAVAQFADIALGKSIVRCNDRPGFIANSLGMTWALTTVAETVDAGLTVEEADAIIGKPMGIPNTGVFGLIDLVGVDIALDTIASMASLLPKSDFMHSVNRDSTLTLLRKMIADGYTGRKGKGGFYRLRRDGDAKIKEAINLKTVEYRAEQTADIPEAKTLATLLAADTKYGRFASRVLGATISYAATLVPSAAADIDSIDEAMRLGYNWRWGPFELADMIGVSNLIALLERERLPVPAMLRDAVGKSFYRVEKGNRQFLGIDGAYHDITRRPGVIMLEDIKRVAKPVLRNGSAAVWDIGDGVLCFEFTSKANALDDKTIELLDKTIDLVQQKYKAFVIYNEGQNFSVGANLGVALFEANIAAWGEIEKAVATGQQTLKRRKYAPFPTVAAPAGMALGGGCEIVLHSSAVQASAETYIGLVETGSAGVVPGWGGGSELLARLRADKKMPHGPMPAVAKAFETISTATVSKSAAEAKEIGFLRKTDGVTMNRYRLLADAKARALAMAADYKPPAPPEFSWMPGRSGQAAMRGAVHGFRKRGMATPHDEVVNMALAEVVCGGDVDLTDKLTEQQMLDLERAAFMRLVKTPATLARIQHVLETGKPLRN
ncbi:MAG TPA: 3-hydroxyacyl-CoA dehydrogenase NAD-binding domain-containing protein [Rhizomicrobium sp.]|nr:3-hydroxyacyl-CoA dehydrogenase NAD-binding domain-containing protein [Rhizomicrobium sp.]